MKEKYVQFFQNRNYLKLFIADCISRFGDSLDAIAMTILVYSLTQSASWSALIYAVNFLPTVIIQPFAGTYIEKKDKKKIMVFSDIIRGLIVGVIATQLVFNVLTKEVLLAATLLISFVEAFRQPASTAIVPQIIDREQLDEGMSLRSSATQMLELAGLGLSGLLIQFLGIHIVIYIDMVTFVCSAFLIMSMSVFYIIVEESQESFIEEFKGGLNIVIKKPQLAFLMILAIYLNAIMTPYSALQAPLVEEVLHSNSMMLSMISTILTLGMIAGSLIYPMLKERMSVKTMMLSFAYMLSLNYIGVCLAGYYIQQQWLLYTIVILLFFFDGLTLGYVNVFANTELLKIVPENYLSRVSALAYASSKMMMPITSFVLTFVTLYCNTFMIFITVGIINIIIFTFYFMKKLSLFNID